MDSLEWFLHELEFKIDQLWYDWTYGYWKDTSAGQVLLGFWPAAIILVALVALLVLRRVRGRSSLVD